MLKNGQKFKTQKTVDIQIVDFLGEESNSTAYKIKYNEQIKVLKWCKLQDEQLQFSESLVNLKTLVDRGTVDDSFLWPIDIVENTNNQFGWIENLIPKDYYDITRFCASEVEFSSYKLVCDAAINIIKAFRNLHYSGYVYGSMDDSCILINPHNGDVLIRDCENIAPMGYDFRMLGTYGYMAPELVLGESGQNRLTDLHSMYVALYKILCLDNPFCGKRFYENKILSSDVTKSFFGTNALFVMDEYDTSNAPHPVYNDKSLQAWLQFPEYVKGLFCKAFCQEALKNPSKRPKEKEALETFVRFRNELEAK